MKTILLADIDPSSQAKFQRLSEDEGHAWTVLYAAESKNCLKLLSENRVDFLIAEMHDTPGIDPAFLELVGKNFPAVIRIATSSKTGKKEILESIKFAHRFLLKPFEAANIEATLSGSTQLSTLLKNEKVSILLQQIDTLPSLPTLYQEIVDKLSQPKVTLADVGLLIKKDVAMSAEILKLINSAFFGLPNRVTQIEQAVAMLGIDTVKTLVLSIKLFQQFPQQDQISISIDGLWRHSFNVGMCAGAIMYEITGDQDLKEKAFTIGMLHDIGVVILASKLAQKYKKVYEKVLMKQSGLIQAEYEILNTSHLEVGAYLTALWGLPDEIVNAILNHHLYNKTFPKPEPFTFAIHIADVFTQEITNQNYGIPLDEMHSSILRNPDFKEKRDVWYALCQKVLAVGG